MKLLGLVSVLSVTLMLPNAFAKEGGKFGIGAFGGLHRIKAVTAQSHITPGGRLRVMPHQNFDIFADFSYYLKKNNLKILQPKLGANLVFPAGKNVLLNLGGHGVFNMFSTVGISQKKLGFGGQVGGHIFFSPKVSLFLEGHFEYWLKPSNITTKAFTVFGGIAGLMLHF